MFRNKLPLIASMVAVLVSGHAVADTVEDRKAKMDAQIELLRKEADLQEALRRVAGSSAVGMPSVVSISRVGDRAVAKLLMANGTTDYFSEGDMIRQGMMVSVITRKQVIVAITGGKKKRVAVPLDFVAIASPIPVQQPGQGVSVPPELLPAAPDVSVPNIVMPAKPPVVAAAAVPASVNTTPPAASASSSAPAAPAAAKGK